ncbi:hypothetical protein AB6A40_003032 [Gnathostoma spinigerum]|uniref:Uncharacterized protein n=1 Tax=Gnathostoma spinigerum TaxID=75299 RepID=A0ABD6E8G5_9BILA
MKMNEVVQLDSQPANDVELTEHEEATPQLGTDKANATPGIVAEGAVVEEASLQTTDDTPDDDLEAKANNESVAEASTILNCESDEKNRTVVVHHLSYPGEWLNHPKITDLLCRSERFDLMFAEAEDQESKLGSMRLIFKTVEFAKQAHAILASLNEEGKMQFELLQSDLFDSALSEKVENALNPQPQSAAFEVNNDDPNASRRLYALHLSTSTDQTVLSSILGSENIESIEFRVDPLVTNEKQAEIVFRSVEQARDAHKDLADGFEIDEGDRQLTMRLYNGDEYIHNSWCRLKGSEQEKMKPVDAACLTDLEVQRPSSSSEFVKAPEISVEDVVSYIQTLAEETRTNWGELSTVEDLWSLCDRVSAHYNGLPDTLLLSAMLKVLELHQKFESPCSWLRRHVDGLIKLWKKEVQKGKSTPRPTAVIMASAEYVPPKVKHRPAQGEGRKHDLATIMSVGSVLANARLKFATEEGELDIDEDENGSYRIGGEPLTFESWAMLNNTSKTEEPKNSQLRILPAFRRLRNEHRREIRHRKMEEEKVRKMREGIVINNDAAEGTIEDDGSLSTESDIPKKRRRELEEGEMSSDSSSSSVSSSDDDDSTTGTSRDRRRKRRNRPASGAPKKGTTDIMNPKFTALFEQLFQNRTALVKLLNPSYKKSFLVICKQIKSAPQESRHAQQKELAVFMKEVSARGVLC